MPQGQSRNPYETWLKAVKLGPGMALGGGGGNTATILLLPGFSYNAGGTLLVGENLGSGSWTHQVVWDPASATSTVQCLYAPTSNATLPIKAIISGVPTQIAQLNYFAGSLTGSLTIPTRYVMPTGTVFELIAPVPADPTLGSISGTIYLSLS